MLQPLSTAIETVAGVSVSTIGQPPQQALGALLAVIRTIVAADYAAVLLRTDSVTAEVIACDPPDLLPAGSTCPELIDAALADGQPWFGRATSTPILAGLCGSYAVLPLGKDVAAVIGRRSAVDFDADERTLLNIGRGQLAPVAQWTLAERTYEERSLRFDAIVHAMRHGVLFVADDGGGGWVNEPGAALLGLPAGEVEAQPVAAAMAQLRSSVEQNSAFAEGAARLLAAPDAAVTGWLWEVQGEGRRVLNVATVPVRSRAAAGRLWLFSDITADYNARRQREAYEAALSESEEKWRSVFNLLPVGISVVDGRNHVTDTNPALSRILRLSEEGILSGAYARRRYWRADHTPMPAEEFPSLLALKTNAPVQNVVIGVETEDGALIWTSVSAAPLYRGTSTATVTVDITELKQAQEQLRLNEARLRAVIENIGNRVWSVDRQYRLLVANSPYSRGVEALLGRYPALGDGVLDGFPEAARAFWQSMYDRALAGEAFTFQAPAIGRTNSTLEFYLYPIRDAEGTVTGVAGRASDITDRLLAEAALRASEERFRTIFMQAPLGIAVVDSLTAELYEVNPRFAAIAGRTVEEMAAIDWLQITHPDDVQEDLDNMAAMNAGLTGGFQMDKRYLRPDGTIVWISMTVARLQTQDKDHPRHLCMIEDISERMQAQQQLQGALSRVKLATDAAEIGIWEWDFASDKLIWDDRLYAFYEVPAAARQDGLLYNFWRARVHPDDFEAVDIEVLAARNSGEPWAGAFRVLLPDGHTRYIQSASITQFDHTGQKLRMIGINRDITQQRLYEQYLNDANATLEQRVAERTAELSAALDELKRANQLKDEFMAAVSHELRTPLTGVLGMAEALEEQYVGPLNQKQMMYVRLLRDSGERLLHLVNSILRYTALIGGRVTMQHENCLLSDLCATAASSLRDKASQKQQSIQLSIEPPDLAIISDSEGIVQVLQQLLDNAVKFTPEGGRIGLEVRRNDVAHCVNIHVWDTGIGMAAEQQGVIFQPFVQADASLARRFEGTGLGLAYVRGMVDLLGGSVSVESEPGRGSRFTVTLPLSR